jgi:hypothetical protein
MAIRECGFAMPELLSAPRAPSFCAMAIRRSAVRSLNRKFRFDHLFKIAVMQRFLRPAQLPPAFDDPHNALLPIGLEPLRKVLRLRPIPSHLE